MSTNDPHFKIRIPSDVLEALQIIAAHNGRSTTQEIGLALESFVKQKESTVKTQVRLPPLLHLELTAAAKRNGRSLNAEMVARLAGQRTS